MYEIVDLNPAYLDELLEGSPYKAFLAQLRLSYFSEGSKACCLMSEGRPVFAGGIVNLQWKRGEAWILPTPFFRKHPVLCVRALRRYMPTLAQGFRRVQAVCVEGVSASLFRHLGFLYEGTLFKFGPNGEDSRMYAKIFEDTL